MHTLQDDDQAVSPVIGVILMVAITVLLAATAAVFFFNLGETQDEMAPTVAFDVDYEPGSSDVLTITHNTGDDLTVGDLTVVVSGADPSGVNERHAVESISAYDAESTLNAGDSITISEGSLTGSDLDLSDATVKIVWNGQGTSQSRTLREWPSG
ncbi:type IV pilin [Halapricum salinum]|uniref:Type IV pilin n=1 Tax=Halapricum salinum TaxID=1457250 RepID=A0A4D6HA04_9EURY|nr:type IV pilin N-terminal domain-containing protein [Halapricum salinum]QCC49978.1 type IV pilin [Halapricum salinum]